MVVVEAMRGDTGRPRRPEPDDDARHASVSVGG
jgi:hypothetical protein